ncbi:MAG: AbrB/MazE/SpoVT family DNA-binding domain-containing protein [Candidatus Goldbacteria bacterium]|nr:AbrB/MazE/SpoVT family DNA-binding domain-containing protein [Candidatus Goldiibacteriota bacterium]
MYTITVTQKGQIVIPAGLRKKLNIKKGTKLLVKEEDNGIFMSAADADNISKMRGALKSDESMTGYLLRERAAEYAQMDKKWKK